MEKFKVGDKVRILEEHDTATNAKIGGIAEIIEDFDGEDYKVLYETNRFRKSVGYIPPKKIELVAPKPTKNQRITALENTVEQQGKEINELKLIVEQLRKPSTVVEEALPDLQNQKKRLTVGDIAKVVKNESGHNAEIGDIVKIIVDEKDYHPYHCESLSGDSVGWFCEYELERIEQNTIEKSANEQRAEMIEKAKEFLDENGGDDYHFDIDEKNGTVFAYKVIISGVGRYSVKYGLSKCHPNDVFNTDIGKVISFGRAEKLDVSEFEQAIQPTVAVGQLIEVCSSLDNKPIGRFLAVSGININGNPTHDDGTYTSHYKIINDTNARY